MIAFYIFLMFSYITAFCMWAAVYEGEVNHKVSDPIQALAFLMSIGLLFSGIGAAIVLTEDTEPHYYPVLIHVPTTAEKP